MFTVCCCCIEYVAQCDHCYEVQIHKVATAERQARPNVRKHFGEAIISVYGGGYVQVKMKSFAVEKIEWIYVLLNLLVNCIIF